MFPPLLLTRQRPFQISETGAGGIYEWSGNKVSMTAVLCGQLIHCHVPSSQRSSD